MQIISSEQNSNKIVRHFRQDLKSGGYSSADEYSFIHVKETSGAFVHVVRTGMNCKVIKLVKGLCVLKPEPLLIGTARQCIDWTERQI